MPLLPNGEAPKAPKPEDEPKTTLGGVAKVIAALAAVITALGGVGVSFYTAWAANNKADQASNKASQTIVEIDRASASVFNILKTRIEKLEAESADHTQFKVDIGILTERTTALQNRMNRRYGRPVRNASESVGVGGGGGGAYYGVTTVESAPVLSAMVSECAADEDCEENLVCEDSACVIPPAPAPAPKKPAAETFDRFEDVKQYYQAEEAPWEPGE